MSKVLVTGGAGFIGSHTTIQLINRGFDVCIADSLVNSSDLVISQIQNIVKLNQHPNKGRLFFRKGDLRDKNYLHNLFNEFYVNESLYPPFDFVIHFAGLKSAEESVNEPLKYWNSNLIGTLNLLETMHDFKCYSLVFSSSAYIYEPNLIGRFKENSTRNPINPYGNTKFAIEKVLEDLFKSDCNKWRIANLRYFNPAGAHDSGLIGEFLSDKPNNLFPIVLKVAMGEYKELSIYGNNWPTKDGTCIRDYIHIMDLADAHLAALEFLKNNNPQIIAFNIGTGIGTSVKEIIEKFKLVNNVSIPYKFKERRTGDHASVIADNSLSLNLLKWKPQRNINDICKDLWKYSNTILAN